MWFTCFWRYWFFTTLCMKIFIQYYKKWLIGICETWLLVPEYGTGIFFLYSKWFIGYDTFDVPKPYIVSKETSYSNDIRKLKKVSEIFFWDFQRIYAFKCLKCCAILATFGTITIFYGWIRESKIKNDVFWIKRFEF